jgi:hypothetical protein
MGKKRDNHNFSGYYQAISQPFLSDILTAVLAIGNILFIC